MSRVRIFNRIKPFKIFLPRRLAWSPLLAGEADQGKGGGFYPVTRRFPRYDVGGKGLHAGVFLNEEVEVENLSVAGACIRTPIDLRVGANCLLLLSAGEGALKLAATVAWRREEGKAPLNFLAGLHFFSHSAETVIRLKDFMRFSGEPDPRRLGNHFAPTPLRFFVKAQRKARLRGLQGGGVKKLSRGGMLAEMDIRLKVEGRYAFTLHLPPEKAPVILEGRVASLIDRQAGVRRFHTGIEFLDFRDRCGDRLAEFIDTI